MRGKILANPKEAVTKRRADLLAAVDQLRTEIQSGADGTVTHGPFSQVVRVDNFSPELDQVGVTPRVAWSLSASWSEFPNQNGQAQCEFTVARREDNRDGKALLGLSGRIESDSETAALSALTNVTANFAAGYTAIRTDKRSEQLSGKDGDTFVRLSFDYEFEKTIGGILGWKLRRADSEETKAGMFRRLYAGYVEATAVTFDAAYQAAVAKARAWAAISTSSKSPAVWSATTIKPASPVIGRPPGIRSSVSNRALSISSRARALTSKSRAS
jgi:hypothetical protein